MLTQPQLNSQHDTIITCLGVCVLNDKWKESQNCLREHETTESEIHTLPNFNAQTNFERTYSFLRKVFNTDILT